MTVKKYPGSELWFDGSSATLVNESSVSSDMVMTAMEQQVPELAALIRWGVDTQKRAGGMFERDKYVTPGNVFEQMRVAYGAAQEDDVVSGVLDTTESLAFAKMDFEAEDPDEEDVWNQIAGDLDLDSRLREMWRELFTVSQFYCAVWYGVKTYKVGRVVPGQPKRKKEYTKLKVPIALSLLDPLKVIPVGNFMFGTERLAYHATRNENDQFVSTLAGNALDATVLQLIESKYTPDREEASTLANLDIDPNNLFLLNKDRVWRHTATRSSYERFAHIRMRSVFELLDLKNQLKQMDRAHLIGGPLRIDQRIPTPEGWKPIGAARVGDEVFSVDGLTTTIVGVYPQGVLTDMHKVTFTDGTEVVCDLNHPWTVVNRRGRSRTIPLSRILEEGLFESNGPGKRLHRHRIPIAFPLVLPEVDLPLDPYLLGYMLGDGSFTQSTPKITCAETMDEQPWRNVLPSGITVSQYETRPGFCPQYGLKGFAWHQNEVTAGLRDVGLWGMVDEDKFIPDEYLWSSEPQRWALLQGLCDSDGHSHQAGGVEIATVSEKLAMGIVHLAQSLGGVATIGIRPGVRNERDCHRVWVSLHQTEAPFRLRRKILKWQARRTPYVRAFHSVVPVADAEAICIKTARDDGLFLTEGMVVTHNTNFIVLVTKGSDNLPAKPQEITALATQVKMAARVPIIVGDHRLDVKIITPETDSTLNAERYNTLDTRIEARLFQMFMTGRSGGGAKGDDSIKVARVVARGLESRRHMLRRSIEANLVNKIFKLNEDQFASGPAKMVFHPKRVALDFDPAVATFLQDLRDRGDISRETVLDEMDFSQYDEARKRQREKKFFDDIFETTIPFSGAAPGTKPATGPAKVQTDSEKRAAGRTGGGNRNGGGSNPDSKTPNSSPVKPRKGSNE